MGQGQPGTWALLRSAHGQAGQGCEEREAAPPVASLGQELIVSDMGSCALDRVRVARS